MELVRQCGGPQFLSQAVKSLTKVYELSLAPLPFTSILVAQAEGSLGSKERWDRNLHLEWCTWPSGLISMLCPIFYFSSCKERNYWRATHHSVCVHTKDCHYPRMFVQID